MVRRSRTGVIIDILTEVLDGANKTRIMYRANLNFLRFKRYLALVFWYSLESIM